MNIVYTVNGEGMGHAARSSVVIDHLLRAGHRVAIFSAGERPLSFLRQRYGSVAEVLGLHMVYRDNKVYRLYTAAKVLFNMRHLSKDLVTIRTHLDSFAPDVVITDFDFHAQLIARTYHIPIISIDNIQHAVFAKIAIAPEDLIDYEIAYMVARAMVPRADHYFITAYVEPTLRKRHYARKVTFVPPLIRDKVITARSESGSHILVYQTADSTPRLFTALAQSRERYIVYNAKTKSKIANVTCKEFNEDSFIRDLASAKAVITNGGFTTISEALYLRKPVLSVPISHHYEQRLNGLLLEQHGYGMSATTFSRATLDEFVRRIPTFRTPETRRLLGNKILFAALETKIQQLVTSNQKKPPQRSS